MDELEDVDYLGFVRMAGTGVSVGVLSPTP